jgi:tetratricopeptide (TPR) repeat protein
MSTKLFVQSILLLFLINTSFANEQTMNIERSNLRNRIVSEMEFDKFVQAKDLLDDFQYKYVNVIWLKRDNLISQIKARDKNKAQAYLNEVQEEYSAQNDFLKTINASADELRKKVKSKQNDILCNKILEAISSNQNQISQVVCEAGDEYQRIGETEKAGELYNSIVINWPDSLHVIWAQMHLIIADIQKGNVSSAQSKFDILMSKFSENQSISQVICEIADEYWKNGEKTKAEELYNKITTKWPDDSYGMWAQMHLTVMDIQKKDSIAAQERINHLMAKYSNCDLISQAICTIADEYLKENKDDKSNDLYRTIINKWPNSVAAMWAEMHLVISEIRNGNMALAKDGINSLKAKYSNHYAIAQIMCRIADEYEKRGENDLADVIYSEIAAKWPNDTYTIWALKHVIISNIKKDKLTEVSENFGILLKNFSDNVAISQVICEIADEYRYKADNTKSDELYKSILTNWPDGSHAIWAKMHLDVSEIIKNKITDAQEIINKLAIDFPDNEMLIQALNEAAGEYQKNGNFTQANVIYQKIFTLNPKDSRYLWTKVQTVISQIDSPAKADIVAKKIQVDYPSWKDIDYAVLAVAEKCYQLSKNNTYIDNDADAYLNEAISLLEGMSKQTFKDNMLKASVCYMRGLCCQELGEYQKAAESFKQVFEANTKYKFADYSLFAMGTCYTQLVKEKKINEEDGKAKIQECYQKLLKNYPDSNYAPIVRGWNLKK